MHANKYTLKVLKYALKIHTFINNNWLLQLMFEYDLKIKFFNYESLMNTHVKCV